MAGHHPWSKVKNLGEDLIQEAFLNVFPRFGVAEKIPDHPVS